MLMQTATAPVQDHTPTEEEIERVLRRGAPSRKVAIATVIRDHQRLLDVQWNQAPRPIEDDVVSWRANGSSPQQVD